MYKREGEGPFVQANPNPVAPSVIAMRSFLRKSSYVVNPLGMSSYFRPGRVRGGRKRNEEKSVLAANTLGSKGKRTRLIEAGMRCR